MSELFKIEVQHPAERGTDLEGMARRWEVKDVLAMRERQLIQARRSLRRLWWIGALLIVAFAGQVMYSWHLHRELTIVKALLETYATPVQTTDGITADVPPAMLTSRASDTQSGREGRLI